MPEATKPVSFLQAAASFFGVLPGQTKVQFLQETKELTDADKAEITEGLRQNGYNIA